MNHINSLVRLENFIARMHRIEQQNKDNFALNLDVKHDGKHFVYTLTLVEEADGHTLTSGRGPDLEHALDELEGGIDEALADIGYRRVD